MKDKLALLIFAWGGCTPTPNTAEEIAQVLLHTNLCWKKKKVEQLVKKRNKNLLAKKFNISGIRKQIIIVVKPTEMAINLGMYITEL